MAPGKLRLAVVVLLVSTAAAAQTDVTQNPPTSTVVVPVVGSVTGANDVHWRTDVVLHNTTGGDVSVVLTMPATPDANFVMLPMASGAAIRLSDIAAALGVANGLSPLVVQTSASRSVAIFASAYGTRGTDTFTPQPIIINYGAAYFPVRVLHELSFSGGFRTNLGLANLGAEVADFTLALQRVPGRNLAVTRLTLPPNALWHMSIQSAFPMITDGDHFSVVVETASPDTYAYASVIENATNTARFVQPVFGASPSAPQ